jgi:hypothetical protein
MAIKKKATKKKSTTKKKSVAGGIAAYVRKIQRNPQVAIKTRKIKKLESQLKAAKKEKATAVKLLRKKLKK